MAKSKIKKTLARGTRNIPSPSEVRSSTITFSFKHIDFTSYSYFSFSAPHFPEKKSIDQGYVRQLFQRIGALEQMTVSEFISNRSPSLRTHEIDWDKVRCDYFPQVPAVLRQQSSGDFQFELTRNEHGRVHGFFTGPIFHIVWLDPGHQLDPGSTHPCW